MNTFLSKTLISLGVVITLCSVVVHADSSALLASQMSGVETISAQFQQKIFDNKGQLMQEANGELIVKRPRQLHWLTKEPYEHLVVTDGKDLWLYDIDLEQVNKEAFSEDLDRAPALLLSGNVDVIAQNYRVEQLSLEKSKSEKTNADKAPVDQSRYHFRLIPLKADGLFTALEIVFVDKKISSMTMSDSFDQITKINFLDVYLNQTVDDSVFKFVTPEGVDLISNER